MKFPLVALTKSVPEGTESPQAVVFALKPLLKAATVNNKKLITTNNLWIGRSWTPGESI